MLGEYKAAFRREGHIINVLPHVCFADRENTHCG